MEALAWLTPDRLGPDSRSSQRAKGGNLGGGSSSFYAPTDRRTAVNYNSVLVIPAKWTVERMSQQASYLSELEVGRFPEHGICDLRLFGHVAQKCMILKPVRMTPILQPKAFLPLVCFDCTRKSLLNGGHVRGRE